MSVTRPDQFPNYQPAGHKKTIPQDESSAVCLQPPQRDIQTPKQMERFRKSYKEQPGVTIKHYGVVNDHLPPQNYAYGVPTEKSQGAQNVMKSGYQDGVNRFKNQLNESKYKSFQKQPLGRPVNRNYNMPQQAKQGDFKFGQQIQKNEYGAKQTIYSGVNMFEDEEARLRYLKSHGDYDAGEQKKRNYNWNIDPSDFRFGKVEKNVVDREINQVMAPEAYSEQFPQTKFVKTNQNDFINRKQDKLGKPANLGQKQFSPDHVFGTKVQGNEWDAGKCLRGEPTSFEVRPDDDLGKSNRHGFRNIPKEGDQMRLFGVPTIRYDIPKPARQSVADPNNYADETTAVELLFPKQFAAFGIDDEDFMMPRKKSQIKEIFANVGISLKDNIFDVIFQRSKAIEGTILEKVSCNSFKKALYQMSTPV